MNGGKSAGGAALMMLAGCAAQPGALTIRPIATPVSLAAKPVPARIAEARGHLALGNVGLALEAFRIARRDDPQSTDALLGMAQCYERMGRGELSRRYYEEALAIAPKDPGILTALAVSLDDQGKTTEALSVRQEVAVAQLPVQMVAPVVASAPAPTAPMQTLEPVASSITVKLPPPRPADPQPHMDVKHKAVAAADPEPRPDVKPKAVAVADPEPRLERLSLGEVALVTTGRPRWRTQVVSRTYSSTTVRFVPLSPSPRQMRVRVLNAARHEGLAARTRVALRRDGWGNVAIGDARRVRDKSLVLFSAATAGVARRLAAELGFGIARDARPGPITLLLGRDAIDRTRARS